jgi:hypothetical protein
LLVAAFELDVVPERFLEDKLLVTAWLIEKLHLKDSLPFPLDIYDERFRDFIRSSKEIYYLYDEDIYLLNRPRKHQPWIYHSFWSLLHMVGACTFVILLPIAVITHDSSEGKVGWITGSSFVFFCLVSYLSGNYVPVLKPFRGWILMWNPFCKEPYFMLKLKRVIFLKLAF